MYFSILETTVRPYLHTSQHYHELNYLFFFLLSWCLFSTDCMMADFCVFFVCFLKRRVSRILQNELNTKTGQIRNGQSL